MLLDIGFLVVGCGLLFLGGDWLVDGVSCLSKRLKVSPILIAFVLVGFGTSAPELFVAIDAVLSDVPDIAMGNIVGSNIANLLLVLALTAIISPLVVDPETLRIDGGVILAGAVALWGVTLDGVVSRLDAVLLIIGMVSYLLMRWHSLQEDLDDNNEQPISKAILLAVLVLAALPLGANLFVNGASNIAAELGVSEAIIGLTIVALGTSLPEIAVSIVAALRRECSMVLGGILGSNVFNGTIVLGGAALFRPIVVADPFLTVWIPIMIAVSVLALILLRTGHLLTRPEGFAMLAVYLGIFIF